MVAVDRESITIFIEEGNLNRCLVGQYEINITISLHVIDIYIVPYDPDSDLFLFIGQEKILRSINRIDCNSFTILRDNISAETIKIHQASAGQKNHFGVYDVNKLMRSVKRFEQFRANGMVIENFYGPEMDYIVYPGQDEKEPLNLRLYTVNEYNDFQITDIADVVLNPNDSLKLIKTSPQTEFSVSIIYNHV